MSYYYPPTFYYPVLTSNGVQFYAFQGPQNNGMYFWNGLSHGYTNTVPTGMESSGFMNGMPAGGPWNGYMIPMPAYGPSNQYMNAMPTGEPPNNEDTETIGEAVSISCFPFIE